MTEYDFSELSQREHIMRSKQGDHQMLIALLRSGEKLSAETRRYLADQISREPKKRFAAEKRRGSSRATIERDRGLLSLVIWAKLDLAIAKLDLSRAELSGTPNEILAYPKVVKLLHTFWADVPDSHALDLLAERGYEFSQDDLNNAKRRYPGWAKISSERPLLTFSP